MIASDRKTEKVHIILYTQLCTSLAVGYFHKPQPVGQYELEKCTRTLGLMRAQLERNVHAVQVVQVTNRMLSDLEGRGIMRTAPETCNLNAYLDDNDVLAAEFIRTFQTIVFPGGAFVHRQEVEMSYKVLDHPVQNRRRVAPLPSSKRLNPKSPKLQKPDVDIYGYRGTDPRVHYLNPWEFMQFWAAEQLLPPCSQGHKDRTGWLDGGLEFYNEHKYDAQESTLKPGIHYEVLDRIAGVCCLTLVFLIPTISLWLLSKLPFCCSPPFQFSLFALAFQKSFSLQTTHSVLAKLRACSMY